MNREERKHDHINHAIRQNQTKNPFGDIHFIHQALSTQNVTEVSLHTTFLDHSFPQPILINAMTGGGGQKTYTINRQLAELSHAFSIPMAVGSQMAAIKEPNQLDTYQIIRKTAPKSFLLANLGAEASPDESLIAIEMIEVNALQIHFNHIQELTMPEGDRDFSNRLKNLESIVKKSPVPVIAKEVGFGFDQKAVRLLRDIGVQAIDISGKGGTNFSEIENLRRNTPLSFFDDWGIPTPTALIEAATVTNCPAVIASGGIKSSLDIAKSLALGAKIVGMSGFFIQTLIHHGQDQLHEEVAQVLNEIKLILTALNAKNITDLEQTPLMISGEVHHWITERGIKTEAYAQRGSLF